MISDQSLLLSIIVLNDVIQFYSEMEGITVHHTHIIYTKDDRSRVKPRFMHGWAK